MSEAPVESLPLLGAVNAANLPKTADVWPSGGCFCPSNKNTGTLCIRVDRAPGNHYCYLATYHNFGTNSDFEWLFNRNGKVAKGLKGTVIDRDYQWGPDRKGPLLDCALIQLTSDAGGIVKKGIYNVTPAVMGASSPAMGSLVCKQGVTTGFTFGKVSPAPAGLEDPVYSQYLFWVEGTDEHGNPNGSAFAQPGDSGAAVVIDQGERNYVAGMVIQSSAAYTTVSRIDHVLSKMQVRLHSNG